MKISRNWLSQYLDIPVTDEELSTILTSLGLEVEGMKVTESIQGGLRGILTGEVVACGKHPNADKLSLTRVDIGGEKELQIVCGAPNVAKGQKVLVATIGTTLYPLEGEPWKIKKGKIRGEVSEGMICSEDEIGLGEDHAGIMVLKEDVDRGLEASKIFKVEKDTVYEIGLTPNRSDATSHIGVARDLAAYFKIQGPADGKLTLPSLQKFMVTNHTFGVDVKIEDEVACPRYSGVTISNIRVNGSPQWLKNRLNSIGLRPINNVVDITNYVLHEYGQPLHAFDADKIAEKKVIVKCLPEDSLFISLDEQERKLSSTDLMICDGNSKGMCIAGVFGGIGSGVTDKTTRVFLESAHFNAKHIRLTSMKHQLRTDAAMAFEKGSDPNITVTALKRAAVLICELAGGEITSDIVDVYPETIEEQKITISYESINRLIGIKLEKEHVHDILKALDMEIAAVTQEYVNVRVPTNKTDVIRPPDVIEEILRIHGFNNVPVDDKLTTTIIYSKGLEAYQFRKMISTFLVSRGLLETMNLSLTMSRHYEECLPAYTDHLVYINNTSNVQLDIMRPELMCSSLEAISYNHNRQQENLRFFEFGKQYKLVDKDIKEEEKLTIALKGNREDESWLVKENREFDYYDLKRNVLAVLNRLGFTDILFKELSNVDRFEYGMTISLNGIFIGELGAVKKSVLNYFGIRGQVYYAELSVDKLLHIWEKMSHEFQTISKYPGTRRDLALVLDDHVQFKDVEKVTKGINSKIMKGVQLFDVYKNEDQLGQGKKSYAIRLDFEDDTKTLKDKEVDKVMRQLIGKLEHELRATIRN